MTSSGSSSSDNPSVKFSFELKRCLETAIWSLDLCPRSMKMIFFVYYRTLSWGKLKEDIPLNHWIRGSVKIQSVGLRMAKTNLYKTRKGLVEKGFLIKDGDKYCLNLLNILHHFYCLEFETRKHTGESVSDRAKELGRIMKLCDEVEGAVGVQTFARFKENLLDIADVQEAAAKMSVEARKGKAERMASKELGTSTVATYLNTELIKYHEAAILFIHKSTNESKKCLRAFLRETVEGGEDAKQVLTDIVKHWPEISDRVESKFHKRGLSPNALDTELLFVLRSGIRSALADILAEEKEAAETPIQDRGYISTSREQKDDDSDTGDRDMPEDYMPAEASSTERR